MSITYAITVDLLPREAEVNVDYFINVHTPLAKKLRGKDVLLSWEVFTFLPDAPYCLQANVDWANAAAQAAAMSGKNGKLLADDIHKYAKT
ncbi:hypothetical protein AnigIFM60653_005928 [Aspergillus niger]|nr:hypothetical protein AnigIFM50267_007763 [Aspergillus niger]GLA05440.1 hypothetical protein AnigIFM60653_005928 [Aspergillus niger]GLA19199.1 hypothetical protein AnigIFM62618_006868 [Aspergillus niger]